MTVQSYPLEVRILQPDGGYFRTLLHPAGMSNPAAVCSLWGKNWFWSEI
jgi:hypothetical protein